MVLKPIKIMKKIFFYSFLLLFFFNFTNAQNVFNNEDYSLNETENNEIFYDHTKRVWYYCKEIKVTVHVGPLLDVETSVKACFYFKGNIPLFVTWTRGANNNFVYINVKDLMASSNKITRENLNELTIVSSSIFDYENEKYQAIKSINPVKIINFENEDYIEVKMEKTN